MSDNSSPDRDWLNGLYPKDEQSPAHLDLAIRKAAHDSVKPAYRAWYGFGAAATVVLAVVLALYTLEKPRQSPVELRPASEIAVPGDSGAAEPAPQSTRVKRAAPQLMQDRELQEAAPAAAQLRTLESEAREVASDKAAAQASSGDTRTQRFLAAEGTAPTLAPSTQLPACAALPGDEPLAPCRMEDGGTGVHVGGSRDCPPVLPITLTGDGADVQMEVLEKQPLTVEVDGNTYICEEDIWQPMARAGVD